MIISIIIFYSCVTFLINTYYKLSILLVTCDMHEPNSNSP